MCFGRGGRITGGDLLSAGTLGGENVGGGLCGGDWNLGGGGGVRYLVGGEDLRIGDLDLLIPRGGKLSLGGPPLPPLYAGDLCLGGP